MKRICLTLALVATFVTTQACAGHKAPILVAQSALATAQSIDRLSAAGRQLTDAAVITPPVALHFQQLLLAANDKLKPLPDILRTVDRLQTAGNPASTEVDRAIAILTVIGQDISVVIGGVPVSDATAALIDLIRAAQQTVQSVLIVVARIQGREQ